jgi:seryl-tRNA synthetase
MLDPKFIRENPDLVRESLRKRNDKVALVDKFLEADKKRRELIQEVEDLKCKKNEFSRSIGALIQEGKKTEAENAKEEVRGLSEKISQLDNGLSQVEGEFYNALEWIPNIPHDSVPVGTDESANALVKEEGSKRKFDFEPKDHLLLGTGNGLFDLERAAKISGSGFSLFTGKGARFTRSLINFMLDVHTREHGYKEIWPPTLVNYGSMRGTGQLPKLEEDMYRLKDEDLFLIPTAEVPLTNLHSQDVIEEKDLPLYYTAYSQCFRREAGSYGKDTKGLTRLHQFDKVELVKFVKPGDSMKELESLLLDAEDILKRLELPYRVITLCTGDLSFSAHKCYDIELWAPGSERWLEVSSCSVFSDFQARRANIKYQPSDRSEKPELLHTLNGSGVALPRLIISILENYQNKDGSITIPEVLRPYFGDDKIVLSEN